MNRAKRALLAVAVVLSQLFDLRDVFVFGGIFAVAYGLQQWSPPLAWCVCGATVFWLGVRR